MTHSRSERRAASEAARKRRHEHRDIQESRIQRLFDKLRRMRNYFKKHPH